MLIEIPDHLYEIAENILETYKDNIFKDENWTPEKMIIECLDDKFRLLNWHK